MVTLDIIQTVDVFPRSNVKQRAQGVFVDFGGPAANAAGVAAGLGARATLVAAIGADPVAAAVRAYLSRAGVEALDLAPEAESAFGVSTVLVEEDSGLRAIVSTNAHDVPLTTGEAVARVAAADAILLDGHRMELCLALARAARQAGVPVVFDGGSWKEGTDELLPLVDVAVMSADFAPPDGSLEDLARGAGVMAFGQSRGEEGWVLDVGGVRHDIAVEDVPVVDTVGAGDALHGALTYAVARWGLSRVDDAARFASHVASVSCQSVSARGWLANPGLVAEVSEQVGKLTLER